jgi:hypothetical protein
VKYAGGGHEIFSKCLQKVTCGQCEVFHLLQYPHPSQFAIQHSPFLRVLPEVQEVSQSVPGWSLLSSCHQEVPFCSAGPLFLGRAPSQWHLSKPHPRQLAVSRKPITVVQREACGRPMYHITLITRVRLQTRTSLLSAQHIPKS